ncbi:MAG: hypothetical protein J7452_05075 [Thermoflexus sp.]|jgi:hypothetical protein|nr:hypothetical protein [Thermoflexus sp.]
MPWRRTRWPLALAVAAAGLGLIGGLVWALRPREEAETVALARRSLRETMRQLDMFMEIYPTAPGAAQGALQRARSAFDRASRHLSFTRPVEVQQVRTDFELLRELTADNGPPETVLPLARRLRERIQALQGE